MANPVLDITLIPTYSTKTIGFADITPFPIGYNVSNSNIEITAPGFRKVSANFVAKSVNVYNANNINICAAGEPLSPLPDGIWTVKYSIAPNNLLFVEKSFIRTEVIECKYAKAFLKLDLSECDNEIKKSRKQILKKIRLFIDGAVASANDCDLEGAMKLYNKANEMLDRFIDGECDCK